MIETLRTIHEQKLNEKTGNLAKINNMIMFMKEDDKNIYKQKGINSKRLEFYKKSQDQIRFRYKYYNYKETNSKSSIKYKVINPETTFNTISYK